MNVRLLQVSVRTSVTSARRRSSTNTIWRSTSGCIPGRSHSSATSVWSASHTPAAIVSTWTTGTPTASRTGSSQEPRLQKSSTEVWQSVRRRPTLPLPPNDLPSSFPLAVPVSCLPIPCSFWCFLICTVFVSWVSRLLIPIRSHLYSHIVRDMSPWIRFASSLTLLAGAVLSLSLSPVLLISVKWLTLSFRD